MNIFVSHLTTRKIALLGLLIALNLVVAKFLSFGVWSVRISFTFVIVFLMADWFGPILAGLAAGLADVVGTLLLSGGQGSYFFGFTISAFLGAFIYGLFFYQKKATNWRILAAVVLNLLLVDSLLNTWWICLLYHTSFNSIFWLRAFKEILMLPIQFLILKFISSNQTLESLKQRI